MSRFGLSLGRGLPGRLASAHAPKDASYSYRTIRAALCMGLAMLVTACAPVLRIERADAVAIHDAVRAPARTPSSAC